MIFDDKQPYRKDKFSHYQSPESPLSFTRIVTIRIAYFFKPYVLPGIAPALVELFGHRDISLKYSVCLSGELFGCLMFYLLSVGSVKLYGDLVSAIHAGTVLFDQIFGATNQDSCDF